MEMKMRALSAHILLLFLWLAVASAIPETFLIGEKEEHCFYIHAEEKEEFEAKVFVFHGGSRDIVFSAHGPVPVDEQGNPKLGKHKWDFKHEVKVVSVAIGDGEGDNKPDGSANKFEGDEYRYKFIATYGEYEVCLSNDRRVEQDAKHVMLDISRVGTEDGGGAKDAKEKETGNADNAAAGKESSGLMVVTKGVEELGGLFDGIATFQAGERMRLTRRNIGIEENHGSMVQSSVMETVVLLVVGVGQIFFVRRWFQGKGTLLKQWA